MDTVVVGRQIVNRKIYKAIIQDDWDSVSDIFEEDKGRLNASISSFDETPLFLAVGTNRSHRFVENLVEKIMTVGGGVEMLRTRNASNLNNALHEAARRGNTRDAKLLVRNDPDMPLIVQGKGDLVIPLDLAAWYGHEETIRFLLSVTRDKALIGGGATASPFKGIPGASILNQIIKAGLFDIALYLVHKYPYLVVEQDDEGETTLAVLAAQGNAFPSGIRLNFVERIIYSRIASKSCQQTSEDYSILENGLGHTAIEIANSEISGSHNFLQRYIHKALRNWNVYYFLASYIRRIRNIKARHVQAEQLLKEILSVLLNHYEDDINLPILGNAIQAAVPRGSHELVEECVRNHPEIIWYYGNVGPRPSEEEATSAKEGSNEGSGEEEGPSEEERSTEKEETSEEKAPSEGSSEEEGSAEKKEPSDVKGHTEEDTTTEGGQSEEKTPDLFSAAIQNREEKAPSEGSSEEEGSAEKKEPSDEKGPTEEDTTTEGGQSEEKTPALFSAAIQNRQEKVFNLIYQISAQKANALGWEDGGNGLHLVAKLAPYHRLATVTGVALQMQRELMWFKEVEKFMQPLEREQRNKENKTPRMVFTDEHKQLLTDAQQWTKDTSSSSTVVAALLVTIAFAAMFTVPGGNNDDGKSIFLKDPVFLAFVISDAIALFSSSTSVLMFLSTLTHSTQEDFLYALPLRLTLGLISLFISLATTMIAFSATLVLVLRDQIQWIVAPVTLLASVPVILFLWLQYPLLHELVGVTFGKSIFHRQSNVLLH